MNGQCIDRRRFFKIGGGSVAAAAVATGLPCLGDDKKTDAADTKTASKGAGGLLRGSFICCFHPNIWDMQYSDDCLFWKEENWRAMIRQMHAVGMDTVLWANSAFWGRPLFPGYESTVGRPLKMGCKDPMGVVADEAERLGMKVFYAIGLRGRVSQVRDYHGLQKPWPDYWFKWNTALTKALVEKYGERPSFGGLYLAYESDFHPLHIELYERLVPKTFARPWARCPCCSHRAALAKSASRWKNCLRRSNAQASTSWPRRITAGGCTASTMP